MEWPADEMDLLPDNEIESRLAGLEGWSRDDDPDDARALAGAGARL